MSRKAGARGVTRSTVAVVCHLMTCPPSQIGNFALLLEKNSDEVVIPLRIEERAHARMVGAAAGRPVTFRVIDDDTVQATFARQ